MSSVIPQHTRSNDYPTTDGRPMAETDLHRDLMVDLIQTLQAYYQADEQVYVSGNLLVFYVPGDRRRHLSPDVFVVKGVRKHPRENYLIWEEGRGPDLVIELTSASTRDEDVEHKMALYRDVLRVREYFLFDPNLDYLTPPMQGYRLIDGQYVPIEPEGGRLPSEVLGLSLERDGRMLRLYDPRTGQRIPTPAERNALAAALIERQQETLRMAEAALREQREVIRSSEVVRRQQADALQHSDEVRREQAEALRTAQEALQQQAEALRLLQVAWAGEEEARRAAELARHEAEAALRRERSARLTQEAELERLRSEVEQLRRQPPAAGQP